MKITVNRHSTDFVGEYCYTHARAAITPSGFGVMTAQPLRLSGSDVFYGMKMKKSYDFGKSWTELEPCENLKRVSLGDGVEMAMADATPTYHRATDKIILIGVGTYYQNDNHLKKPRGYRTVYSVYNPERGDFGPLRELELPPALSEEYFSCYNGCGQSFELESGELLIPVIHYSEAAASSPWSSCFCSAVIRASFDGELLHFEEIGPPLTCDTPRGLYEPSVTELSGEYYLCMRNDLTGYVARGDGLRFSEPVPLLFDDGESVGNYNTQQHWIRGGGKLYIVYTRRGANNDHVFRHRAPLFIAELDTDTLRVKRSTERIAVPERGARLGNFGCTELSENLSLVVVSEWMQTTPPDECNWRRCMEYGSDNSIFVTEIEF